MTSKFINFCGWEGSYGQFEIDSYEDLMDSDPYVGILVIHEGNWINPLNNKFAWSQCEYYEQAQQYFGVGLDFVQKIYVEEGNYTSFYFKFSGELPFHKLVVPATGEELFFKIYGIKKSGNKDLLIDMEL